MSSNQLTAESFRLLGDLDEPVRGGLRRGRGAKTKAYTPRVPDHYVDMYRTVYPADGLPEVGSVHPKDPSRKLGAKDVLELRVFGARDSKGRGLYTPTERQVAEYLCRYLNDKSRIVSAPLERIRWHLGHNIDKTAKEALYQFQADGWLVKLGAGSASRGRAALYRAVLP